MTKQYQTNHVVTKGQFLEMWLEDQSESDRNNLLAMSKQLAETIPHTAKLHGGRYVHFGPKAALELLWALGRLMNDGAF